MHAGNFAGALTGNQNHPECPSNFGRHDQVSFVEICPEGLYFRFAQGTLARLFGDQGFYPAAGIGLDDVAVNGKGEHLVNQCPQPVRHYRRTALDYPTGCLEEYGKNSKGIAHELVLKFICRQDTWPVKLCGKEYLLEKSAAIDEYFVIDYFNRHQKCRNHVSQK
jgi:hypothetical protein